MHFNVSCEGHPIYSWTCFLWDGSVILIIMQFLANGPVLALKCKKKFARNRWGVEKPSEKQTEMGGGGGGGGGAGLLVCFFMTLKE